MSKGEGSRKRAVQLRPDALACLKASLHEEWERRGGAKKLTREARAEILGLSIATSERLLSGRGVDRPTLTLAFKNLGLDWDDSFCEIPPPPVTATEPVEPPLEIPTTRTSPRRKLRTLPILLAAVVVTLLLISKLVPVPGEDAWKPEFHRALAAGSKAFHEGELNLADHHLSAAIQLAREKNAGRDLSSALRMQADLCSARGAFDEAWNLYDEALQVRNAFVDSAAIPAILEAQGDLETRMGRYSEAKVHLTLALEGFRKSGDPVGVSMVCRNLGTLAFQQGFVDAADTWFQTSLTSVEGQGKTDLEIDIKARRALVLREKGRLDDACRHLLECLDYWTKRNHIRWIAVSKQQLGTVRARMGRWGLASALFESARDHFKAVGDMHGYADSSALLKQAAAQVDASVAMGNGIDRSQEIEALAPESLR